MSNTRRRYVWLGVSLSLMLPGLGQIYARAAIPGVALIAAFAALVFGGLYYLFLPGIPLLLPWLYFFLAFGVWLSGLVHAYLCARARNRRLGVGFLPGKDPWLAVFLSIIIPGLGHLYAGRYKTGAALFVVRVLLDLPAYLSPWLFPVLPAYCVLVAANAHSSVPESRKRIAGLKLFVVTGLVVLGVIAALVSFGGPHVADAYKAKLGLPG